MELNFSAKVKIDEATLLKLAPAFVTLMFWVGKHLGWF